MKTRFVLLTLQLSLSAGAVALALALVGIAAPRAVVAAPAAQAENVYITVTVKAGESLANFPRIYGVSGSALLAVNTLADPNRIYPGQVLVIPVVKTFTPSLTTPFYYTAVAGDTLAAVARRFEQDPVIVARLNGVAELTAGNTYLMPAGPHIYVLKRGDTIATVAARYGVSQQFVLNGNNLPNPGVLYAGQELYIPLILDARPLAIPEAAPATAVSGETSTPTATPDAAVTPAATATPSVPTGFIQITVQPGDTLTVYVKKYAVSARAIIDANPTLRVNPALLMPGQKLLIPATGTPTATAPPTQPAAATSTPAASATPGPSATPNLTPAASNYIQIAVRRGESLVTYVNRFGVTASSLLAVNPALKNNPSLIYPGQTLVIPVLASFTPSRTTPFFYIVQATDTAALIARQFEISTDTLLRANPGASIVAGATVLIPAGSHYYVVKKGDELRDVAALYGTTVEALQSLNNLPNPDLIYVDQELLIPLRYNAAPLPFTP